MSLLRESYRPITGVVISLVIVLLLCLPIEVSASISIAIDRDSIDYGDIFPGHFSAVETVGIDNSSSSTVQITIELQGEDALAQSYYEQALYVNDVIYDPEQVVCSIPSGSRQEIDIKLRAPSAWRKAGVIQATLIFWAETSS